jgi:hypothetical protein
MMLRVKTLIMALAALRHTSRLIHMANTGAVRPFALEPDWLVGLIYIGYENATHPRARNAYYAAAAEWALRRAQEAVYRKLAADMSIEAYSRYYRPPPR